MRAWAHAMDLRLGATAIALLLVACAGATRPAAPPRGEPHHIPRGAISVSQNEAPSEVSLGSLVPTHGSRDNLRRLRNGSCDAAFAGERIFAHASVPAGTYPNLQSDLDGPATETVTVGSSVFVDKGWAQRHPQGYLLLMHAVSQTRTELLARTRH